MSTLLNSFSLETGEVFALPYPQQDEGIRFEGTRTPPKLFLMVGQTTFPDNPGPFEGNIFGLVGALFPHPGLEADAIFISLFSKLSLNDLLMERANEYAERWVLNYEAVMPSQSYRTTNVQYNTSNQNHSRAIPTTTVAITTAQFCLSLRPAPLSTRRSIL